MKIKYFFDSIHCSPGNINLNYSYLSYRNKLLPISLIQFIFTDSFVVFHDLGRCHRTGSATSSQMKVTKMLLLVSSVFVLLNLPSYLMRVMAYIEVSTYIFIRFLIYLL